MILLDIIYGAFMFTQNPGASVVDILTCIL